MSEDRTPHPKNAPGPFYVVKGCCIQCMAPHEQAPTLMGFDSSDNHCFVAQQPHTEAEVYTAIRAVRSSEVQCIRYSGEDPNVLRQLVEIGEAEACDHSPPTGSAPTLRNHVTFEATFTDQAWDVATALRDSVLKQSLEDVYGSKVTALKRTGNEISFAHSWFEDHYYVLRVGRGEPDTNRWLVRHSPVGPGSVSLSLLIDDWLRSDPRFNGLRWYTADGWRDADDKWQERPY